jgi:hypothetical protein
MGSKITIGEARESGADGLTLYCAGAPVAAGECRHSSEVTMMLAIALWGAAARLDDLRLRCSLCGSRKIDVRPHFPLAPPAR